jgi:hypothetical protein
VDEDALVQSFFLRGGTGVGVVPCPNFFIRTQGCVFYSLDFVVSRMIDFVAAERTVIDA